MARLAVEQAGIEVRQAVGLHVRREWDVPALAGRAGAPRAALVAGPPEGPLARGHTLAAGRWLRADDAPEACVVEAGVAAWLGRAALAPGDVLTLPDGGDALRVVGVTAPRAPLALATDDLGFRLDHPMYARFAQGFLMMMGVPVVRDGWKRTDRCVWVGPRDGGPWTGSTCACRPTTSRGPPALAREALAREQRAAVTLYPIVLPMLLSGAGRPLRRGELAAMFLACLAMGAVVMANVGPPRRAHARRRDRASTASRARRTRDVAAQFLAEGLMLRRSAALLGLVLGCGLAELRVALEPVAGFDVGVPVGARR